jgi:uroporphyrin-III C-methyltransferase
LVAVIQNGSLESQRIATGTIATIADAVIKGEVGTPAIIVIGEVVKFYTEQGEAVKGNEQGKLQ